MGYFFNILHTAYTTAYKHGVEKKYTEPKIYHGGKHFDLSKRWYVYYSYAHPTLRDKQGRPVLVRQTPITLKVNRNYKTKEKRLLHFGIIKDVLHEMLKGGFSPYKDEFKLDYTEYTAEAALDYAYSLKVESLSDTSIPDYRSRLNQFKTYLKSKGLLERSILDITKQIVNGYLNGILKATSARNRNNTRIVISALFGVLEDNDIIQRNFVANIKVLETNSVRHQTYSLDVLEGLFSYMKENDPLLLLFIKFVSYNVLRPIEVCRLRIKDINLDEKQLQFKAKNKPTKTKIIPDIVVNEIMGFDFSVQDYFLFTPNGIGLWPIKENYRRDYFTKRFKKLKEKYNDYLIEQGESFQLGNEYTVYSFRHTFITLLFRKFREEFSYSETCDKLMLITGHSTLKALKTYLKDIDAELPEDYSGLLGLKS
ncbi:site-specific recombinase XerD [Mariniflexile fucanivorans]|uniref:Site-specific recombinase XerD n=1 Tax=Mariniflexile fucanivorans TaxID=264023 RepID=A0A4R1RI20_9FLAO|nr:site-specific integrase [Mariniflexile fucanivorans]TCL65410.1 site-specific recombinase XerD [Mariniflexile fucanivorans]